ncbi:hypothetical protein EX30DRAFT_91494 [Ascodesmis nigricans]|uniref:Uncharacterized protein n=1 Tax=Ascodesmis nigricans TaxID=341454 RepID=A0A4V3SJF4_9PEZI|nr:hypothetical protein EX30DRAFT_91494 [Ascodesmis nigricans]
MASRSKDPSLEPPTTIFNPQTPIRQTLHPSPNLNSTTPNPTASATNSLRVPNDRYHPISNSSHHSQRVPSPEPPLIYHVPRLLTPDKRDHDIALGKYPRLAQRVSPYAGNRAHSPSVMLEEGVGTGYRAGSIRNAKSGLDGAMSINLMGNRIGNPSGRRDEVGNRVRDVGLGAHMKSESWSSIDTEELVNCSWSWKKVKRLVKDWAMGKR